MAKRAEEASSSLAREEPPGLKLPRRIWSFLKSVGLSTTRTPFSRRHSVMPTSSIAISSTTLPGVGGSLTRGASRTRSIHGSRAALSAFSNTASNSLSSG